MTNLISSQITCEIIHILGENKTVVYLDETSINEYDISFKFNSNQLDCELELNESFKSENKFKLTVWNIPSATLIVNNDIIRLYFNWEHNPVDRYYTECTITNIVTSIESNDTKTIIEGTFLLDNILYKYNMEAIPTNVKNLISVTSPFCKKFGLTFTTNIIDKELEYNIISTNKSISTMLNDFCTTYNTRNNTDTCRWFLYGDSLIVEDEDKSHDVILYKTPIIKYIDILKYKLTEETETKKSIEIEISGLPSLTKESFITIDYTDTPSYIIRPDKNETFIVTEVKHKIGTLKGFYSTVYCYLIKSIGA